MVVHAAFFLFSGQYVNRRQVLKLSVGGSLLAATGLTGCEVPRLSRGIPSVGASAIAWTDKANSNVGWWVEAVREMRDVGLHRVALISYAFVDPATGAVSLESKQGLPSGPSKVVIQAAMEEAAALGLEVSVRPWVEIDNGDGAGDWWRGHLVVEDKNLATFFDSYRDYVLDLAQIAARGSVARFYIGSELASLTSRRKALPYWKQLIRDCRQTLADKYCLLSYAANFDEFEDVPFWQELDEIGVDAYFKLSKRSRARGPGNPPDNVMRKRWLRALNRLEAFSKANDKSIFICEWGVVPFDTTTSEPSKESPSEREDRDEAERAYKVVLQSLQKKQPWLKGVDFWHWQVDPQEDSNYRIKAGSTVADLIGTTVRANTG